ncbi:vesicular inhibitory amino acid transporter [Cloeon dipterum]|uniref:vesicular inhibitory amino acid transporter n=1 Tax=Cloeon dipterum TaxID=197152 RepID=UPI00322032F6
MPAIPGFNMSAIGPVVGSLWETAKSKIPSKCKEMAGGGGPAAAPNENTNFAKFGGGGPQQRSAGSHEMRDLGRGRAASTTSSDDFCGGESSQKGPDFKINEWQAAWNVTNAIQGMFIVSLPFAVRQGGYWAIAAMIGIAHICCYTGKILVDCLYEDVDVYEGEEEGALPPRPPPPTRPENISWEDDSKYQSTDFWDQPAGYQQQQSVTFEDEQFQSSNPNNPFYQAIEEEQKQQQQAVEPAQPQQNNGVPRGRLIGKRKVRVRDSYVAIARDCLGPKWGKRMVHCAQLIELLMTCILYVVVCGDLMVGTFPEGPIDTRSWMMICGILLIPLSFLKSLHAVSVLSFWCTMSHLFINAIILGYCLLELPDWGWGKVKWTLDLEKFPISLGVIVFSYTSQIFLPTLEGNMEDPSKFRTMLDWSHIAAAIFKSLFGYMCFLTFQSDTQQVITNNLHSAGFKGLVNIFLVVKAILSYPLPYYAACQLLERAMFRGKPKTYFPSVWELDGELKVWGLAFRVGVIIGTILMAISIPHFATLMGFIGSFTGTMLSFIWPCYFHIILKGHELDDKTKYFNYFIIFLGVLFGVIGIWDSGSELIRAFSIGLPF